MKYAITGHTSGIGAAMFQYLSPNCIGFSKSTGYDITNKIDRKRIINDSAMCDVFINNASAGFGQSELLHELWKEWKYLDKTVINVGSKIADDDVLLQETMSHLIEYRMQKLVLKQLCQDLSKINTKLEVKYCSFSYVGTDRILKKYPNFTEIDYISVDTAIGIILNA
jgi:hypothetical protein